MDTDSNTSTPSLTSLMTNLTVAHARIATLEQELAKAMNSLTSLRASVTRDSCRLSDWLIDTLDQRGLGDLYDEMLGELSHELKMVSLQAREREYEVDVELESTITLSHKITVTATSPKEAESMVPHVLDKRDLVEMLTENLSQCDFGPVYVTPIK